MIKKFEKSGLGVFFYGPKNETEILPPIFIILNDAPKSEGANKKNRIKKKFFWRRYEFLKIGYFRWAQKR